MFRLNNVRMPRIKTMAIAARQSGPSFSPEPKPFARRFRPNLIILEGGKAREPVKPKEKKQICTFCANELNAQEADDLMEWRKSVAIVLGHKNPEFRGKREIPSEDLARDCEGFSFTYFNDKDRRS